MADITNNEMRELLNSLGDRLDATTGDSTTAQKLEDIKKILQKVQSDISKSANQNFNASSIGKAIADAIAQSQRNTSRGLSGNNQQDLINSEVEQARQAFINEFQRITDALKTYGSNIGNGSGGSNNNGQATSPFASALNTIEKESKLAAIIDVVGDTASKFVSIMKTVAGSIEQNIDTYRQMTNIGQTFGGSIITMRDTARAGNMTLESFTKALLNGTTGLKELGGTQFAAISKNLRASMDSVANFGMTIDQTNEALGEYIEMQRNTVGLNNLNQANINKSFADMLINTTNLSAAFGVARDDIINEMASLSKDPNLQALLTAVPDTGAQQDIQEIIAAATKADPNEGKALTQGLAASEGNFRDPQTAIALSTDPVLMQGIMQAFQQREAGQINEQGLEAAIRNAAVAAQKDYKARGNLSVFAGGTDAYSQGITEGNVLNNQLASIGVQQGAAAQKGLTQLDPQTKALEQLNEATNRISVALEAAETDIMRNTTKSATVLLNDFIDGTKQLPDISKKFDTLSKSLSSVDSVFADWLKKIGPSGVGMAAAFAVVTSEITAASGSILALKIAFDAAKLAFAVPARLLSNLTGGGSSGGTAKTKSKGGSKGRGGKLSAAEESLDAEGEAALGGAEDIGAGFLGTAASYALPAAVAAAIMRPTALDKGENRAAIKQAASDPGQLAGGWIDQAIQKMSPTELSKFGTLSGSARDNFLKQKAMSLGIIPNSASNTKPTSTSVAKPTPPTTSENTVQSQQHIAESLAQSTKTLAAVQTHMDALTKQLADSQLINKKFHDLLSKISDNTYATAKNILKTSTIV